MNDDSRVINKLETSLTDAVRVIIYDRHMFIVQATDLSIVTVIVQLVSINDKSVLTYQKNLMRLMQPSLIF
jgi:hypothetical protein